MLRLIGAQHLEELGARRGARPGGLRVTGANRSVDPGPWAALVNLARTVRGKGSLKLTLTTASAHFGWNARRKSSGP
jgi:hypothetical protein